MSTALVVVFTIFGTLLVLAIVCVPLAFRKTKASPKVFKECPTCGKWSKA